MINDFLTGIRIYESVHCLVVTKKIVRRTWRERLFTWPWRPWVVTKIVEHSEPSPHFYQITDSRGRMTYIGHPVTVARLRSDLSKLDMVVDGGDRGMNGR